MSKFIQKFGTAMAVWCFTLFAIFGGIAVTFGAVHLHAAGENAAFAVTYNGETSYYELSEFDEMVSFVNAAETTITNKIKITVLQSFDSAPGCMLFSGTEEQPLNVVLDLQNYSILLNQGDDSTRGIQLLGNVNLEVTGQEGSTVSTDRFYKYGYLHAISVRGDNNNLVLSGSCNIDMIKFGNGIGNTCIVKEQVTVNYQPGYVDIMTYESPSNVKLIVSGGTFNSGFFNGKNNSATKAMAAFEIEINECVVNGDISCNKIEINGGKINGNIKCDSIEIKGGTINGTIDCAPENIKTTPNMRPIYADPEDPTSEIIGYEVNPDYIPTTPEENEDPAQEENGDETGAGTTTEPGAGAPGKGNKKFPVVPVAAGTAAGLALVGGLFFTAASIRKRHRFA